MDIETTPRQFLVTNQMNITVCVLLDFLWVVGNHQDRLAMLVSRMVHAVAWEIKLGSERIAAPRSEGSALHRRTSGGCCLLPPALAAVSVPGDGEDHSVSRGFYPGGPGRGSHAVESGSSSRSSVDGPVIAPCRRREVLAQQAWHRRHSEPCPAWGGKRWRREAGRLPCRRSGGCPGWTGPAHAS